MQEAILQFDDQARSWQSKIKETEAQLGGSDRRRKEALEREAKAKAELETLRRSSDDKLQRERSRAAEIAARLDRSEVLLRLADGKVQVAEGRAEASEMWAKSAEEGAAAADARAKAAESRAAVADARAEAAESKAAAADARAEAAEGRAVAADARAKAAEERLDTAVAQAVEAYKDSDEFECDAAEAGKDIYLFGFEDCRKAVAEAFPGLDIGRVTLAMATGGEEAGGGEEVNLAEALPGGEADKGTAPGSPEVVVVESPEEMTAPAQAPAEALGTAPEGDPREHL